MQYGAIPENVLESLALWAGKVPVPLMDSLFSILKARGLMAAVSLGIFESLARAPKTAQQLADERKLDVTSLELLLRCMAWAGYLKLDAGKYELSKMSEKMMVLGSEMDLTGFVQWNYVQWRMVEQMENLLLTGKGVDFHKTMTDSTEWGWYQKAMMDVARFDAAILAKSVPVKSGARKLIDVAGSHGLLGAAICRKHPPMQSTVIDLPAAIEHARRLAKSAGLSDIVDHRAGDIMTSDFGRDNDVALLANIIHHFMPDQNIGLLKRLYQSLTSGGSVAIWDFETPDPQSRPAAGDGAALYFRLTSTAYCYSRSEYSRWLREAGFGRIRVKRPAMSPGKILVTGIK